MRVLVFLAILLLVVGAGYTYAGWRIIGGSKLPVKWRRVAWVVLWMLFLLPVGMFALQASADWGPSSTILVWPAYIALGWISFVVTLLLVRDGAWMVGRGVGLITKAAGRHRERPMLEADRRRFLVRASNLGVLGAATVLTGYGIARARRIPPIVTVEIPIRLLHPDLEGMTILQITDIHTGLTVDRSFVEEIVAQANTILPDLVVVTGDLVDGSVPSLRDDVAPIGSLAGVYGRYFVTGNHEYYSGVEPWLEEIRRLGFTILLNQHVVLRRGGGSVILAGVTDPTGGDFLPTHATSVARAIEGSPEADLKILLAHQPKSIFEASRLGIDLQLSGHTHGGQFVPWNFFAAMAQPYISGLHLHERTWIYVSRGAGYWGPPVRVGAASEISLLRLVREPGEDRTSGRAYAVAENGTRTLAP